MEEKLQGIYTDLYQVYQQIENYPPDVQEEIQSELESAMSSIKQTIHLIENN